MADKKILIVEDDNEFLWILRESFHREKLPVLFAQDGEEALAKIESEKPDLVILDIMLPKMDGMEVAKKIKEKGINCKIIFLTNLKDPLHVSQAMEIVGDTDYIVKSDLHVGQIIQRVRERLEIK
jgi:two-component system, OmpR family, alkaline phosphatase synthesis response regulator PhoP